MAEDTATIGQRLILSDLQARNAAAIDDDRLEEWPGFFTEDCHYRITNHQDFSAGLRHGIIFADSRAMLEDRVAAIRGANIFEAQRYRHILNPPVISSAGNGWVAAVTGFAVIRTMQDGKSELFVSGEYRDRVMFDIAGGADQGVFAERVVVLDSQRIDTLLAIPL